MVYMTVIIATVCWTVMFSSRKHLLPDVHLKG